MVLWNISVPVCADARKLSAVRRISSQGCRRGNLATVLFVCGGGRGHMQVLMQLVSQPNAQLGLSTQLGGALGGRVLAAVLQQGLSTHSAVARSSASAAQPRALMPDIQASGLLDGQTNRPQDAWSASPH
jgi:hypothetical protein